MIGAGLLNRRITLNKPSTVQNAVDAGDTTTVYTPQHEVWASVKTDSSMELIRNGRTQAELVYSFRIRYIPHLREDWTVTFYGKTLNISKIIPVGAKLIPDELDIIAVEVR